MPTHDDATLMMELLQWHTASGGMEASRFMMSPDFDAAAADSHDRHVFVMLMMGETIGTFVKQGLLDAGLVYDLWAVGLVWDRVGPAALRAREKYGVPALWENFEALARNDVG
ncbi:DUF4760 domain-containing protein [Demequina mangrovi]|uniref:Uncharacterized protein n=1 Tax=Demequina mangrovi TaxID=1043493 RepID=A0A1H7A4W8_9MICO|nr:hypothetical protein [Demequina mangrovi]SEJ58957.1 hypothetical protein SAMN05421637_2324 [Demequina mangrovi]